MLEIFTYIFFQLMLVHGFNDRNHMSRMFGGTKAPITESPWHVQICLQAYDAKKGLCKYVTCGAALLKFEESKKQSNIILTAAHCVAWDQNAISEKDIHLYVGSDKAAQGKRFGVKKVIIHPKYNSLHLKNDIAILISLKEIPNSKYIKGVLLPTLDKKAPKDEYCTVSGFGKNCETGEPFTDRMQILPMPYIGAEECSKILGDKEEISNGFLFCAGLNDSSHYLYVGDSGGAYVCTSEKKEPRIYGIVSEGSECDEKHKPAFFVNVAKYLDWIYGTVKLYTY